MAEFGDKFVLKPEKYPFQSKTSRPPLGSMWKHNAIDNPKLTASFTTKIRSTFSNTVYTFIGIYMLHANPALFIIIIIIVVNAVARHFLEPRKS